MSDSFLAVTDSRSAAIDSPLPVSPSFRLRVGIVGCGRVSEHHVRAMAPLIWRGQVVVSAVVDPDHERRRAILSLLDSEVGHPPRAIEASSLSDVLESVDECVDAVLVSVPHDLHENIAASALRAGVHVLLEKPLAPTLAGCDRLLAVVAESEDNGMLVVSEQSPHWPEVNLDGVAKVEASGTRSESDRSVFNFLPHTYPPTSSSRALALMSIDERCERCRVVNELIP